MGISERKASPKSDAVHIPTLEDIAQMASSFPKVRAHPA